MSDITTIFSKLDAGDPSAAEELLPLVYEELRKLAETRMAREKAGQTLQATALVHEAYLRLATLPRAARGTTQNVCLACIAHMICVLHDWTFQPALRKFLLTLSRLALNRREQSEQRQPRLFSPSSRKTYSRIALGRINLDIPSVSSERSAHQGRERAFLQHQEIPLPLATRCACARRDLPRKTRGEVNFLSSVIKNNAQTEDKGN